MAFIQQLPCPFIEEALSGPGLGQWPCDPFVSLWRVAAASGLVESVVPWPAWCVLGVPEEGADSCGEEDGQRLASVELHSLCGGDWVRAESSSRPLAAPSSSCLPARAAGDSLASASGVTTPPQPWAQAYGQHGGSSACGVGPGGHSRRCSTDLSEATLDPSGEELEDPHGSFQRLNSIRRRHHQRQREKLAGGVAKPAHSSKAAVMDAATRATLEAELEAVLAEESGPLERYSSGSSNDDGDSGKGTTAQWW